MVDNFISKISHSLNIRQGNSETLDSWRYRVVHSCIGLHMLSASYDYDDDSIFESTYTEDTVSMVHVIKRGKKLTEVFDNMGVRFHSELPEEIRSLYIKTGFLLHRPNRVTFPTRASADYGNGYFVRGVEPWAISHMSGIGVTSSKPIGRESSPADMFCFEGTDILDWYGSFEKTFHWQSAESVTADLEYLDVHRNDFQSYWISKRPDNISLARNTDERERVYRMMRVHNNKVEQYILPSWRTENGEYLRIGIALRLLASNPPSAMVNRDGFVSNLSLDYLLPEAEQNFFEVYSWALTPGSRWKRIISTELIPFFLNMLTRLGFTIKEEL